MNILQKASLLALVGTVQGAQWYEEMQFGPAWANTFSDKSNGAERTAALKGVLVDLGERKNMALYDTETLRWVSGYAGFVNWGGTPWTGAHGALVSLQNDQPVFITTTACGWADAGGSFDDKRELAGFGNLPKNHGRYLGHYKNGNQVIFESEVLGARVLETMKKTDGGMERHVQIGPRKQALTMLVADENGAIEILEDGARAKSADGLNVVASAQGSAVKLIAQEKRLVLSIPAGDSAITLQVVSQRGADAVKGADISLVDLTKGGPAQYPEVLESAGTMGKPDEGSSWAVDSLALPASNPWKSNMRVCAFDFLSADSAAVSTWNGDVWTVSGFSTDVTKLKWRRIASGLFDPLGLKVVNGVIHVLGRDGITQLIDLNGDGETDHFKAFNRDVLITRNFHEFAFDLHTDQDGNFYFCKGSPVRGGGRGFDQIIPNHGIVAKVSKDGGKFEVVVSGLRAPGGLAVGPQGQITTGENEGTWQPCCKLNYVMPKDMPAFVGTEPSRHKIGESKPFHEPLCYFPMDVDNSGGSQVWVPPGVDFGLKAGELIHLSYGQSSLYRVMPDVVGGTLQGGVARIPVKLSSSAMRARFHQDGSLFVSGFRGWQTNAASEASIQRIRYVKESPVLIPTSQKANEKGVVLTFAVALDEELANDIGSYGAERWNYVRGPQYGSGHFSVDKPDAAAEAKALETETSKTHRVQDKVEILSAKLSADGKSVAIELKDMKPSMTLKLTYDLESTDGDVLIGSTYTTVRKVK